MRHSLAIIAVLALTGCDNSAQQAETERLQAEAAKLREETEQLRRQNSAVDPYAEVNAQANRMIAERRQAALEGRNPNSANSPPAIARPYIESIPVNRLVDRDNSSGIAGYMLNPTINLNGVYDVVAAILIQSAGQDEMLTRQEAERAIQRIEGLQSLSAQNKRSLRELLTDIFQYGVE